MARTPHNKKAHKKDRKGALEVLKDRDVVLVPTAMREGWPENTMADALRAAIAHLAPLMRSDIGPFRAPEILDSDEIKFDYIDWQGKDRKRKGILINIVDGQAIYRDKDGNLYSMPRT